MLKPYKSIFKEEKNSLKEEFFEPDLIVNPGDKLAIEKFKNILERTPSAFENAPLFNIKYFYDFVNFFFDKYKNGTFEVSNNGYFYFKSFEPNVIYDAPDCYNTFYQANKVDDMMLHR